MSSNERKYIINIILRMFILIGIVSLTGCASRTISLHFNASNNLNPDVNQQALPVQVKVFQLRNKLAFENASFDDLWQQGAQALAKSYISVRSLMLLPNSEKTIDLGMHSHAKFIGFVAIYRTREANSWRVIKPVPHVYFIYPKFKISLSGHTINVKQEVF